MKKLNWLDMLIYKLFYYRFIKIFKKRPDLAKLFRTYAKMTDIKKFGEIPIGGVFMVRNCSSERLYIKRSAYIAEDLAKTKYRDNDYFSPHVSCRVLYP